jgi:hypothetical protein
MKDIEGTKEELKVLSEMKNNKNIIPILVDFDSTMVLSDYPYIKKENGNCSEILKRWVNEYNVGIILNTMRSDEHLQIALDWIESKGIPLYGVGENPTQKYWTNSNKPYGIFSIDDINVGCPLRREEDKYLVDWDKIVELLEPKLKTLSEL